ncbi:hypothetical protein QO002_004417 [Pararhizobium capsulatum DSM 1112]|uniref:Hedgehog/Intein (Hint) domain-containing protein n=1 Tax=Pararhizobium capsulatum DSM 1112 TaxID=1121113 RepID=A0ABU0BVD1_9HYPH|nr:Hint domain-containing protein [Pararhizobium capsulatum]MDQ0322211.1 hypothetical protein [Pararhizobium capsulatum DSM 1112]
MPVERDSHTVLGRTRRHFLGLTAAAGAKAAAILAMTVPTIGYAKSDKDKDKDKDKGDGSRCFVRGTSILTTAGEVPVESLRIGDLVKTANGTAKPVKWIGFNRYQRRGARWPSNVMPIRIAKNALGKNTPYADLYLSPGHGLLLEGVLIQARDLVNGSSVVPALPAKTDVLEYFHIVLDTHEAVLANGAATETFLMRAGNHEDFSNFAEFARLYSDVGKMLPLAATVGYGGRLHLKALLRLAMGRFLPLTQPAEQIYETVAARCHDRS